MQPLRLDVGKSVEIKAIWSKKSKWVIQIIPFDLKYKVGFTAGNAAFENILLT